MTCASLKREFIPWLFLLLFIEAASFPVIHSFYQETSSGAAQDFRSLLDPSDKDHAIGFTLSERGNYLSLPYWGETEQINSLLLNGPIPHVRLDTVPYIFFARLKPPPFDH